MSVLNIVFFLSCIVLVWFWSDALRCKEIARSAGQRACKQVDAQFLDDTVEISKIRLRRDSRGHLVLYREYRFEFTHNRDYRLRGIVKMLGPIVVSLELEP